MINRILRLISESGLTANEFTRALDISNSSVSDWKKGSKPSSDTIIKIADYFGVTTDYILRGIESINSLTDEDREWLDLIHSLSPETQRDFKGAMRLHRDLHGFSQQEDSDKDLQQAK